MSVLVDIRNLKKVFTLQKGPFRSGGVIHAVDDISFTIEKGATLGLVGESGCGKTTAGKAILMVQRPTSGEVFFDGTDLSKMSQKELRRLRGRLGIVYQNPHSSLNPRMNIHTALSRPLEIQKMGNAAERDERIAGLIARVGLNPEHLWRYPHEFSGGQKQRIAVARTIITHPDFVVLDEPTSALDVSVQAQILKLLRALQEELDLTYLFISHDISVVRYMSTNVAVMYVGKVVEWADRAQIFQNPLHPYTKALLSVVPIPDPHMKNRSRQVLQGDIPSPRNPPPGCRFHTRCPQVFERCRQEVPVLLEVEPRHHVACHMYST
jgi:oligopeptide transport system ATP-binding protein